MQSSASTGILPPLNGGGSSSSNHLRSNAAIQPARRVPPRLLPSERFVVGREVDRLLPASDALLTGLEMWPEAPFLRQCFDEVIDS